jgi:hypothetical protein
MESTLLFGVKFPSDSIVIVLILHSLCSTSSSSGEKSVDVLLIEFPSDLKFNEIIDTELVIIVLEDAV